MNIISTAMENVKSRAKLYSGEFGHVRKTINELDLTQAGAFPRLKSLLTLDVITKAEFAVVSQDGDCLIIIRNRPDGSSMEIRLDWRNGKGSGHVRPPRAKPSTDPNDPPRIHVRNLTMVPLRTVLTQF